MQVTGKDFFWMQNLGQNLLKQKANSQVNPLLKQVQSVLAQQGDTKTSGSVSKEMEAKLLQIDKESKIDPADKALRQVMQELMFVEQEFYGALSDARGELRGLVERHEVYTSIVDGTADYEMALRDDWHIDPQDRGRFEFTDFQTYLKEKGYQGDGTKPVDYLNAEWKTAENSFGMNVSMLAGQTLVKGPAGTLDQVIFEDQMPLYEQWQEEKTAFEVAALKEYAAEKLPQVQQQIEDFPQRLNQIAMMYAAKRAEIIDKLPEGALKDDYLENMKSISDLAKEMKNIKPGDGKELLSLLQQMMDKQAENVVGLGGVANDGFGGRIKMGRLPTEYYA